MRIVLIALLSAAALVAQDESAKIRSPESGDGQATVLGEIPSGVLSVEKTKGTISKIDLKERTVTVQTKKNATGLLLSFSQPEGREQIKTSKKSEKLLGKKRLRLDELKTGTAVEVRYYPLLSQIMELTADAK